LPRPVGAAFLIKKPPHFTVLNKERATPLAPTRRGCLPYEKPPHFPAKIQNVELRALRFLRNLSTPIKSGLFKILFNPRNPWLKTFNDFNPISCTHRTTAVQLPLCGTVFQYFSISVL
jgi:hypothetical protein